MTRVPASLVPPSVADARGRAFGGVIETAADTWDFGRVLHERLALVDPSVLPALIRECSIEEFVEPGLPDAAIRALLAASFELHALKGSIAGVRRGLDLIGVDVIAWQQWFERQPIGAPGTHVMTVRLRDPVFEADGRAITVRAIRAVHRMVDGMKRWSQDVMVRFDAAATTALYVGAAVSTRVRISPRLDPITLITGRPAVFVGAAVSTRVRVRPGVPVQAAAIAVGDGSALAAGPGTILVWRLP
jgi:phage tail P2-like protein